MSNPRRAPFLAIAASLLAIPLLSSCFDDPLPGPAGTALETPEDLMDAWETALEERDAAAWFHLRYSPEAAEEYRFQPMASDLADLPWCEETTWGEEEEARLIAHLFDPEFEPPGWSELRPVTAIEARLVEHSRSETDEGEVLLTVDQILNLMHAAGDTTISSARIVSTLGRDANDRLKIESQREIVRDNPPGVRGWVSVLGPFWASDDEELDIPSPEKAVEEFARAWRLRSLPRLKRIISSDYRFTIRSEDAESFPWMTGNSWGRDIELTMAEHMFDRAYQSPDTRPVDRITIDLDKRSKEELEPGLFRLVYEVNLYVWFSSTDALHTVGIWELDVGPEGADPWVVRAHRERDPAGLRAPRGVESASWGRIKERYL